MQISLQTLRAFQLAAELGSFTAAAEKMYMTQPAFSRLMAGFEEELGIRLFDRYPRRVALNEQGRLCLRRVSQMLKTYDQMLSEISFVKQHQTGKLTVGYNPVSGPPAFFVEALRALHEKYPGIQVDLVRAYSGDLVRWTAEGKIDCALVSHHYLGAATLDFLPLQPIYLYAMLSRKNSLAAKDTVSIRDLANMRLIFMTNSAPRTRLAVLQQFDQQDLTPIEDSSVNDLDEMVMRVRIGQVAGITSFSDPNGVYPDLAAVRILEFSQLTENDCRGLAWRRGAAPRELSLLREILENGRPPESRNGLFPYD